MPVHVQRTPMGGPIRNARQRAAAEERRRKPMLFSGQTTLADIAAEREAIRRGRGFGGLGRSPSWDVRERYKPSPGFLAGKGFSLQPEGFNIPLARARLTEVGPSPPHRGAPYGSAFRSASPGGFTQNPDFAKNERREIRKRARQPSWRRAPAREPLLTGRLRRQKLSPSGSLLPLETIG